MTCLRNLADEPGDPFYEVIMLACCANPSCGTPVRSFAEGRLFQFEIVSISVSASDDMSEPFDEKPERTTAQFWLCGNCSASMTLLLEPQKGLRLVPISQAVGEEDDSSGLLRRDKEIPQTNC